MFGTRCMWDSSRAGRAFGWSLGMRPCRLSPLRARPWRELPSSYNSTKNPHYENCSVQSMTNTARTSLGGYRECAHGPSDLTLPVTRANRKNSFPCDADFTGNPNVPGVDPSLWLAGVVSNRNEHFGEGFPSQNYFERVAAKHFDRRLSISRVVRGNDSFAVQKHLVAACFVCASTVSVGNCQNTAAIGRGVHSKVIRSGARFFRRTCKEGLRVYAGRVARALLWVRHGCLLSRQTGGADETQEDNSKPTCCLLPRNGSGYISQRISQSIARPSYR